MVGEMVLRIWDVEHGACAMLHHEVDGSAGPLAMVDSGCTANWRPSLYIRHVLNRKSLQYLFITNADQDHMSDLNGLWQAGVHVEVLTRNPGPAPAALRKIKEQGGELTGDIERFLSIHETFNEPVPSPFNEKMGGIRSSYYYNAYPRFTDTNNLSLAVFFEYCGFKILFPGDLEEAGWLAMLEQQAFRDELSDLTVLVASHHGRANGYCEDLFKYCSPRAVVMSDKSIVHGTQELMTQTYRRRVTDVHANGVVVANTRKRRHVLTTRRDGWIEFRVLSNGDFIINTEYDG